jgi:hypothetical protein
MKNSSYNTNDVKTRCENKLRITFRATKEFNGWYIYNNKKVARITIPMGRKDIPPKTYKSMANQLKLSADEFDDLLDCPLDRNKYNDLLNEKKYINIE